MGDLTEVMAGPRWSYWRIPMWGGAAVLLTLPAIAMQLDVSGVDWSVGDFVAMGVMLAVACGACELVARMSANGAYRLAAAVAIGTAFLTVWADLAVGMVGSEGNAYNQLFGGVIALALAGSALSRFRAAGTAWAMLAAAVAQALFGALGLSIDQRGAIFSMAFAPPWLISALLFRKAAREQALAP